MRCDECRKLLEEAGRGAVAEAARAHLKTCPECRVYAEDWGLVLSGLHALAEEQALEASVGFEQRLLRQLREVSAAERAAAELAERAGRRVALATLIAGVVLLLALGLAPGGPIREPASAELMAQADQRAGTRGIVFADDSWLSQKPAPGRLNRQTEPPGK